MPVLLKILAGLGVGTGVGVGAAKLTPGLALKFLAGGLEITAGVLDVLGYVLFIAFILGWRKGGERCGVIWPLSIVLEVVSKGLWTV